MAQGGGPVGHGDDVEGCAMKGSALAGALYLLSEKFTGNSSSEDSMELGGIGKLH